MKNSISFLALLGGLLLAWVPFTYGGTCEAPSSLTPKKYSPGAIIDWNGSIMEVKTNSPDSGICRTYSPNSWVSANSLGFTAYVNKGKGGACSSDKWHEAIYHHTWASATCVWECQAPMPEWRLVGSEYVCQRAINGPAPECNVEGYETLPDELCSGGLAGPAPSCGDYEANFGEQLSGGADCGPKCGRACDGLVCPENWIADSYGTPANNFQPQCIRAGTAPDAAGNCPPGYSPVTDPFNGGRVVGCSYIPLPGDPEPVPVNLAWWEAPEAPGPPPDPIAGGSPGFEGGGSFSVTEFTDPPVTVDNGDGTTTTTTTTTKTRTNTGTGTSTSTTTTTRVTRDSGGNVVSSETTSSGPGEGGTDPTANPGNYAGPLGDPSGEVDGSAGAGFASALSQFQSRLSGAPVFGPVGSLLAGPPDSSESAWSLDFGSYGQVQMSLAGFAGSLSYLGWAIFACGCFVGARIVFVNK